MSLVNDMLKDLDQRRKSSDNSGLSARLMPASDMPVEKKNRILIFISLALVLVLGGLAYLWSQQGVESTERQLNIVPRVVDSSPVPEQPAPMSTEEGETGAVSTAATALAETPAQTEPELSTASIAGESQSSNAQPAAGQGNTDTAPQVATVPLADPVVSETSAANNQSQAEIMEPAAAVASNTSAGVINQPPPESIKNDAELSSDTLDTLAVQKALGLIADSDTQAAYAHLEQHIINNRYAHQSRETYAKLLMNDGELLAAYNLVESGLGLAPNHPGFKKVKARILIADGQVREAVELLSSRAPSINDDIEYHEILATAQLASRDYEGASMSYTSLVQQDRTQGRWWYGFAASQDSLGNQQAARQAYSRAIAQTNLSPNLRRRSQERLNILSQ